MSRSANKSRTKPVLSEESTAIARKTMTALADYLRMGTLDKCLHCGEPVSTLFQSGRSVYAKPCGCRQYQGMIMENES